MTKILNSIESYNEEIITFANLTHPSDYKREKNLFGMLKDRIFLKSKIMTHTNIK